MVMHYGRAGRSLCCKLVQPPFLRGAEQHTGCELRVVMCMSAPTVRPYPYYRVCNMLAMTWLCLHTAG